MNRKAPVLLVLVLCSAQALYAQQPGEISYHDESVMPTGVVGERISSIISTLNAGDPEAVRRFIEEECSQQFANFAPMEEHISVFLGVRRQTGGVDFHGIRTYVPERAGETVVILKDRNFGAWRAFTLRLDGDGRVAGLGFNDARTPTNVDEPPLSEAQVLEIIEETVERICANDVFAGTVLLAKEDDILFSHACGEASKRFHVPNNIDTRFNIGSMNKMFTATAIAQLVERGELSYDETIDRYVDESWLPAEITSKITIHHLLSHTSGLGSYFTEKFFNESRRLYREIEDFKPLVREEELAFEPGERFRYSNTGMLLLGVVIESVTGVSYFDYIRQHIYGPAGMESSDSYEMDYPVENLAIGYDPQPGREPAWMNNLFLHSIKGGPAGGGFSTVGDLHRFARALLTGRLVSQSSLDVMWTDKSGAGYGYGFGIRAGPRGTVVGHGGGFTGINGDLAIFVEAGYVVAVLSNYSNGASPLSGRIQDLIGRVQP
ncbi:MAG: serine hydrolase domain-containing protein [Gemmatimonadales bacterium]|jgi:CubicO group peptidase (beta-lactamase class C family)